MALRDKLAFLVGGCLLPSWAYAQFSLDVTQIDANGLGDKASISGICAKDACRATIPLQWRNDTCILNIRVGAPNGNHRGAISYAFGPCRSGRTLKISDVQPETYQLDDIGATSKVAVVPIRPSWDNIDGMDDGVVHILPIVRLDIISTSTGR